MIITGFHTKQIEISSEILKSKSKFHIINSSRQSGKDLRNDMLLYYDGYESSIGECNIGDRIFGDDGKLTTIIGKYPQGRKSQYKITLADGRNFICGIGHLHQICYLQSKKVRIVDTQFLLDHYISKRNKPEQCYILTAKPTNYTQKEHYINPYLLGILIGDGSLTTNSIRITSDDIELINKCNSVCPDNYHIIKLRHQSYSIKMINKEHISKLRVEIERLKLNTTSYFKHIPAEYIYDNYDNRLELLKGLMDTDGTIDKKGRNEFCTTSLQLATDITKLCRSLGMKIKVTDRITRFTDKNGNKKDGHISYRIMIFTNINIFYLERKSIRTKYNPVYDHSYKTAITDIEQVEDAESTCISVDNKSQCFLTNDYIITHNTTLLYKLSTALAIFYDNISVCILAPTYSQSKISYDRILTINGIQDCILNNSAQPPFIKFKTGSKIYFKSGDNAEAIRGNTFHYIFVDEAAFINEADFETIIRPTTAAVKSSKIILTSTPKGKKGLFWKYYQLGLSDNINYKSYTMNYKDNPHYDISEVEDAKLILPDSLFKQEYEAEFIDDGGSVFNIVKGCILSTYGQETNRYFAGIDFGRKNDYTVLHILNELGQTVYIHSTNKKSWELILDELTSILNKYKPIVYVETNGIGDVLFEQLKSKYTNIFGWNSNNSEKQSLIESLIYNIETDKVKLPNKSLYHKLYNELEVFTFKISNSKNVIYNAPQGFNDDEVISLGLANKCLNDNIGNFNAIYYTPNDLKENNF